MVVEKPTDRVIVNHPYVPQLNLKPEGFQFKDGGYWMSEEQAKNLLENKRRVGSWASLARNALDYYKTLFPGPLPPPNPVRRSQ